jgi:drug/metabolite transporter (DMT)-like permease
LSSVTVLSETSVIDAHKRRRAVFIVVACTLIGALAQVLIKLGAAHLEHTGLIATAIGIFTIPTLFAGYCLYGVFTVLLVFALRDAELSILYPVIALSYVWVTLASVAVFHESMNLPKAIGLAIIVLGVAVLGRGGSR